MAIEFEVSEVIPIVEDRLPVAAPHDLGAAQRVLDRLAEKPREGQTEELVGDEVERPHGGVFHRIDQPHAVNELTLA